MIWRDDKGQVAPSVGTKSNPVRREWANRDRHGIEPFRRAVQPSTARLMGRGKGPGVDALGLFFQERAEKGLFVATGGGARRSVSHDCFAAHRAKG